MKLVELEAIRDVRNLGRQGGDEDVGSLRELQPGVLAVRDRPVSEMKIAIMYKILLIFFFFLLLFLLFSVSNTYWMAPGTAKWTPTFRETLETAFSDGRTESTTNCQNLIYNN